MNTYKKEAELQSGSFNVADIYYILFRHKWKILTLSGAGFIAACAVFFASKPKYESQAKLLVRYVSDAKPVNETVNDPAQQKISNFGPEAAINAELEILTSLDLAEQVAETIGPDKILGTTGSKATRSQAAAAIARGLFVEVAKKSAVMKISYRHENPETAQAVLRQLIDSYQRKHADVHRPLGMYDEFLAQQSDTLKANLNSIDAELRKLKQRANVISIEESKKSDSEQMAKIRQELYLAEAELADRQAVQKEIEKLGPPSSTNAQANAGQQVDSVYRYRSLSAQLASLRTRETELLGKYTEENPIIKGLRGQMEGYEKIKKDMETQNPSLTSLPPGPAPGQPQMDSATDLNRIAALQGKIKLLTEQMEKIRGEASVVDEVDVQIQNYMRQKAIIQANFDAFARTMAQIKIDAALGPGKGANISVVQQASQAFSDQKTLLKTVGMILGAGIFGGLALAFLLEIVVDQTVRRPTHLESKFSLPLFLSIPEFPGKQKTKRLRNGNGANGNGKGPHKKADKEPGVEVEPWAPNHPMRGYSEALRDRLTMYFQKRNMTHKPKLIGITSCSKGAGVTSIAAGLAATLSETGDGNVLLVDLNLTQGASLHPFFKGKLACGLSDVLELEKRTSGFVKDNLYAATVNDANGMQRVMLPKEFSNFVPKLKASDYDYIIFDMPPVNQTSPTPRLAAMLDVVHLVIESEGTQLDSVKRAKNLLTESNVGVAFILNKIHNYMPKWLAQEN